MKQQEKHSFSLTKPLLILVYSLVFFLLGSSFIPVSAFAMSAREKNIKEAGKLRVCIWPDYFSITYKNKKTGELEGIDIDLSRAFASDLGVELEYVATHFGVFMQDIQADRCDLAMFGVGITEARKAHIDYTEPYLSSGMYGVASKANPYLDSWEAMDQTGVVVVVQKGTYMEGVMRGRLKNAELMAVIKNSQREIEVRSGRADVFIADYPYGQKMLQVYDWAKLLTPEEATTHIQYAYAIKKDQPEWLERVNTFVQAIKTDGRLEKYAKENNLLPIALTEP
ncbi:ABC transporter substrate-binding protein [Marinospirillum insulare]|uniref:Cyclohexadienyl dehydratase n=1 Tax=Marinospirillum insulare TaxID=217169 RepID=A0ABQ5ZXA4_9GAMM|nr:ABC transporter substrate-binding protein [Marinospirillum insulare]GLR63968.1 cyclohexadienyl dehydratase [Marinospirillum insulare]